MHAIQLVLMNSMNFMKNGLNKINNKHIGQHFKLLEIAWNGSILHFFSKCFQCFFRNFSQTCNKQYCNEKHLFQSNCIFSISRSKVIENCKQRELIEINESTHMHNFLLVCCFSIVSFVLYEFLSRQCLV